MESVSCTFDADMKVAMDAKRLGAIVAVISPHSEALHDETLKKYPFIDHLIDYEKDFDPEKPIKEPEAHLRELITDEPCETTFEQLPVARQDMLPRERYDLPFIGKGYTFVITSRGCPWTCIYCRQGVTWKNKVRYRPVEKVIEEIEKYDLTNVAFHADTFTVNRTWVIDLCRKVRQLNRLRPRWVCNSRVDTVDPDLLQEMALAGCWMICYGIESGNNRVLQMNEKGKGGTVENAEKAVRWAKKAGIKVWGYFMLGMYGDNLESMGDTIALSKALPCDIVNFALSAPYPGTKWGRIAQANSWLTDSSWGAFDQNISAIVDQPGCTHEQVKAMQRKAYMEWYGSWRGLRFLTQAWRPRYSRFLWNVAMEHLS